MYSIRRILVALDLSPHDEALIRYAHQLAQTQSLDKIYFVSVAKKFDLPDEIVTAYPDLLAPVDETLKKQMEFTIQDTVGNALTTSYDIDVLEGDTTKQILRWAKIKDVDLVVIGKKLFTDGKGINGSKIARLSPCHVAFTPEKLPADRINFLVPVDFSESSKLAVELALTIAGSKKNASVSCMHVYHVPSGYHVSGKSHDEFAEIMKKTSEKLFGQFISKIDTRGMQVDCSMVLGELSKVPEAVNNFAAQNNITGIVIGSKGKTKAASLLLGSTTERFIHINVDRPLIVAKPKHEIVDIFDVIMNS